MSKKVLKSQKIIELEDGKTKDMQNQRKIKVFILPIVICKKYFTTY
jgi:hypothetical protein